MEQALGEDRTKELRAIEGRILDIIKPLSYSGATGHEAKSIKGYEQSCVILSQHMSRDPKKMTVLEFRSAVKVLEKQMTERKNGKKRKR